MKKRNLFLLLCFLLFLLGSCDDKGTIIETGFNTFSIRFKQLPVGNSPKIITFNKTKASNGNFYIKRGESTEGKLTIKDSITQKVLWEKNIKAQPSQVFTFIQLPGKKVDLYSPETYSEFTVQITTMKGEPLDTALYDAYFKDQKLIFGAAANTTTNYIRKDEMKDGTIKILKKKEQTLVLNAPHVTIKPNQSISILEYEPDVFLYFPPSKINPIDKMHPMIRLVFFDNAFPKTKELRMKFYTYDYRKREFTELKGKSLTLYPGAISEYMTVDLNKYFNGRAGGQLFFELYKKKLNGEEVKLIKKEDRRFLGISSFFKFKTILLKNSKPDVPDEQFDPYAVNTYTSVESVRWN